MSKNFTPGQILVSPHTGQRVRFDAYADDGLEFFKGEYLGNARRIPDMPPQFHYNWNEWRTSRFEAETPVDANAPAPAEATPADVRDVLGPEAKRFEQDGLRLVAAAQRFAREIGAGVDIEAYGYMIETGALTRADFAREANDGGGAFLETNAGFTQWRKAIHDRDRELFGPDAAERPNILSAADRRYGIAVERLGPRFDAWLAEEAEAARRRYNCLPENNAPDWKTFDHLEAVAVGNDPGDWKVDILAVDANGQDTPVTRCETLAEGVKVAHELAATSRLSCSFEYPDLGQIHPDDPEPEEANDWIDARAPSTTCDIPSL